MIQINRCFLQTNISYLQDVTMEWKSAPASCKRPSWNVYEAALHLSINNHKSTKVMKKFRAIQWSEHLESISAPSICETWIRQPCPTPNLCLRVNGVKHSKLIDDSWNDTIQFICMLAAGMHPNVHPQNARLMISCVFGMFYLSYTLTTWEARHGNGLSSSC